MLSQPCKASHCEGPSRAYEAFEAGVLLWPRDFVAPRRPGIGERGTLALLFILFPLTVSAVSKRLACLHFLIPVGIPTCATYMLFNALAYTLASAPQCF